jgi:ectoine hydroxylase-related dioxygenase (phytanoyl-CoA dioxygenase family)
MHWDVELTAPVPFGTQALIYLTDVAEHQGAFCCVPGFHKKIDRWLAAQPEGIDLQQQDWTQWPVKPIAAKAGDLIIWHQALPHGSSPNRADFPRMVQYLNMYR